MKARINTTIHANQQDVRNDMAEGSTQTQASGVGGLSDLLCRGSCRIEGLQGMIHALIVGLDGGGDLSANPQIVTRALYGVLYQIEEIEKIFVSAETAAIS